MKPGEYPNASRINQQHLQNYQTLHYQLERDIQDNHAEIRLLNNKIVKSDYDKTLLQKLQLRQQNLLAKQRELQQTLTNQQYIHQQLQTSKINEKNFKQALASEYQQMNDERKRRAEEQRRRAIEQERLMHDHTRRALEEDQIRRKMAVQEQKRAVQAQLAARQQIRLKEKEEQEREKEEYNKKVQIRNQIETQKDSVYKQYYNQFLENQQTLHNIYKNKAAVSDRQREQHRSQFQRKQIEEFQQRVLRDQQQRVQRMNAEKDMLRSFLKSQIEEKQRKKSREREEDLGYQSQVARYQINAAESEQLERSRRKQEQRRYDEQLKMQTRLRSYSNNNYGGIDPKQVHNPITNPIDFKIGITNPYVIRQYQSTKEKYLGDPQLKLRNLAMVGSTSLNSQ